MPLMIAFRVDVTLILFLRCREAMLFARELPPPCLRHTRADDAAAVTLDADYATMLRFPAFAA